jgi:DNA-binding FadR family transcriptional regulator
LRISADLLTEGLDLPREPLYVRIARNLQKLISEKQWAAGSQLPSEGDLADALGVSRVTVHQAIILLQQHGLVEIKVGSGTFVTEMPPSLVADAIERFVVFGDCSAVDLLSFRKALEPEVAAAAAGGATAEELATLSGLADEIEESFARKNFDTSVTADISFHKALATATHNALMGAVVAGLLNAWIGFLQFPEEQPRHAESIRGHRLVYAAVAARDAAGARAAMQAHLRVAGELASREAMLRSSTTI